MATWSADRISRGIGRPKNRRSRVGFSILELVDNKRRRRYFCRYLDGEHVCRQWNICESYGNSRKNLLHVGRAPDAQRSAFQQGLKLEVVRVAVGGRRP